MEKKTLVLIVALTTMLLILAGCGEATTPLLTAPTQSAALANTATPVPPTATPVPPTATNVPPTATPVPPTNTPAPTATPKPEISTKCNGAKIIRQFDYKVDVDEGDGDSNFYWANVASDGNITKPAFLVLGDPGLSIDFEHPHIAGTTYRFDATTLADAACLANTLADTKNFTVKIYVGPGKTPEGFTKDFVSGWEMRVSEYTAKSIEPGGKWRDIPVARDAKRTYTADAGEYLYFQLWNPDQKDHATHVIVAPGKTLTVPMNFQGTGWGNTGGELTLLIQLFAKNTADVFLRDKGPVIDKLFCGPSGGPMSWEPKPLVTIPVLSPWSDWDCK